MNKKQKTDEPYFIPQAKSLAQELGAKIYLHRNGYRVAAEWQIIYNGVSYAMSEPESVYMFLSGLRQGIQAK